MAEFQQMLASGLLAPLFRADRKREAADHRAAARPAFKDVVTERLKQAGAAQTDLEPSGATYGCERIGEGAAGS